MTERLVYAVATTTWPRWFVRLCIATFSRLYGIDCSTHSSFPSLLSFFLREPLSGARPFDEAPGSVVSPVDARVTACGQAEAGAIVLVKGHRASLDELTGGFPEAYSGGMFLMLYLSPSDIHRIYAPCDAVVRRAWKIEGTLRSVSPRASERHPRTFVENRRVLTELETAAGRILMIKVGARNVGRIVTHHPVPSVAGDAKAYRKGEELGWFELGSTVILLFEKDKFRLCVGTAEGKKVKLGETVAEIV